MPFRNGTLSGNSVIARRAVNEILMDVNFSTCSRKGRAAAGNQTDKTFYLYIFFFPQMRRRGGNIALDLPHV